MGRIRRLYFLVTTSLLLHACGAVDSNSVAIRDFRRSLQPFLVRAVSTGIVVHDSSIHYIEAHTTDKELVRLSHSEHPILRAIAFREMLRRQTFDHFSIIMNHLTDTAIVAVDAGEWGSWYRTVSDFIIANGKWKTTGDRDKTVTEVITKHDYLRSAYSALPGIELKKVYYPYIKEMVGRDIEFEKREDALYALARFKIKEDVPIIKAILMSYIAELSRSSFALMRNYPDTAYLEVLESYYPRRFYRSICNNHGYSEAAMAFIPAIASYKTDNTAKILRFILSRKPLLPCAADTSTLKDALMKAIWENPCSAYSKMRAQISDIMEMRIRQDSLENSSLPILPVFDKDTAQEPVRW